MHDIFSDLSPCLLFFYPNKISYKFQNIQIHLNIIIFFITRPCLPVCLSLSLCSCLIIMLLQQAAEITQSVWIGQHPVWLLMGVGEFSLLPIFKTAFDQRATYSVGNGHKAVGS